MIFHDRTHAGQLLAERLSPFAGRTDVVVLALPRGGVPVAYEVARDLRAPLDVFLVRKLGVPGREELALGAIASGGMRILNPSVVKTLGLEREVIEAVTAEERRELERRQRAYRGDRPAPDIRGRTVLLIDDGLATGSTMRAAIAALRLQRPAHIVVAVPVAAPVIVEEFRAIADEIVCLETPESLRAVGLWYQDFSQTSDAEVYELLAQARAGFRRASAGQIP